MTIINNGVLSAQEHSRFYADNAKLESMIKDGNNKENIMKAAKEFEAIFIEQMFQAMRSAEKSMKSELCSAGSIDTYQEMYDKQLSLNLSQNKGIGLAPVIAKHLTPK